MAKAKGPYLPNLEPLLAAGIDPKTGLPYKMASSDVTLKQDMKRLFRIVDEQDAVNTFEWYNLPNGLTGEELERMLYYKGQLCFFYHPGLDQFFFMPYSLDGTIDFYGRYNSVHPVPMTSGTTEDEKKQNQQLANYLSTLKLNVLKDVNLDYITPELIDGSCVLLRDYTNQLSQNIIPRQQLQEAILDLEADLPCYLRTSLKLSSGVKGMRVNDQSAESNVLAANASLDAAALTGNPFVPVISQIEMQDLTNGAVGRTSDYLEALQAIDNLRLGTHGISNGGLFQKKAHMLEQEAAMNAGRASSSLQDRLSNRQHFCDIVNSYTALGIWCEPKEGAINADTDGDGLVIDNKTDMTRVIEQQQEVPNADNE